jgi:hypothetical protein
MTSHLKQLTLVNPEYAESGVGRYSGSHALVPILLGLLTPVAVLALLDPRSLVHASLLINIYLFAAMTISTGVFLLSVFRPGEVISVTFDQATEQAEFVMSGTFAHKVLHVPFAKIAGAVVDVQYDDDGYKYLMPIVKLTSGQLIGLPAGTTEDDVADIRATLHLQRTF